MSTTATSIPTTCVESEIRATLYALEDNTPTLKVSSDDVVNDYGDDLGHGDEPQGDHDTSPGSLSPTAERALISVGSIGGFIIVCFVFWFAWRMMKKSKMKADGIYGNNTSRPNPRFASLHHFRSGQRGWQDLDDMPSGTSVSPPRYEKITSIGQAGEVYPTDGTRSQSRSMTNQAPTVLPQLQTNFSSSSSISPYSTPTSVDMQSPQTISLIPTAQMKEQTAALPPFPANTSPATSVKHSANISGSPGNSATIYTASDPSSTLRYEGTMETVQAVATTEAERSLVANPIYNQPEVARQPSDAYGPFRRHVYRESELSSISSGFGDGDIIIPPPSALHNFTGASRISYQKVPGVSRKDSVAQASEAGESNRDTIYTTTSEDMPQRYRTVDSWVNQQTGRIQRAAQNANEDVPPVPMMPPEEKYTMMMDDEEPRRPDTVPLPVPLPPLPEGVATLPGQYAESKEMNP
ncbi:hypothetical protein VPNG_05931 [Cytospora leucostoma]|uniref:Uncharacterized protein n=1 Tax=Cytospora leucostoma TaxID=1230097 RepID=A0A423XAQ1_9PEZI|nr:hypothetical protein VPNG_05931 [Cytospora leucostoma]